MSKLYHAATHLLGEIYHFERESYLEEFLFGHPLVLAASEDAPEGLLPVYIIARQQYVRLMKSSTKGITDLICLSWNPDRNRYNIYIYELKTHSVATQDVQQMTRYLDAYRSPHNRAAREEMIQRANDWVGSEYFDPGQPFYGAILAQTFSEEVVAKLIEANEERPAEEKIIAVKLSRFPVDNEFYVVVETLFSPDEGGKKGGHVTWYDDVPKWGEKRLEEELLQLLRRRKKSHPVRYQQLRVFLSLLVQNPGRTITKTECQEAWLKKGLPLTDRGLSVSQLLGYRTYGALRQILAFERVYADTKDNYRLRNAKYARVIAAALKKT